jgi:hypothetical protein
LSQATDRLVPCLPRSTGLPSATSPPHGDLVIDPSTDRSSRSRPIIWAHHLVVAGQRGPQHLLTDTSLGPVVEAAADGEIRAARGGDAFVAAAVHQRGDDIELRPTHHGHHPDPPQHPGRAYYQRKRTAGKSHKEALRCLKRRLSDVIYRQLVRRRTSGDEPGRTRWGLPSPARPAQPLPLDLRTKSLPEPVDPDPTAPS